MANKYDKLLDAYREDDETTSLVWGAISGVLSDQTDLQAELDTKLSTVAFADLSDYPANAVGALTNDGVGNLSWSENGAGANTALSNIASVAINTTLASDTDNTDALGTTAIAWSDLFLGSGGTIVWNSAPSTPDLTLTHSSGLLTLSGVGGAQFEITATTGSPHIQLSRNATELFLLNTSFTGDSLTNIRYYTATADATADAGSHNFWVDAVQILNIDDGGLELLTGKAISINGTD